MVSLVENCESIPGTKVTESVAIQNLYAFALNRFANHSDLLVVIIFYCNIEYIEVVLLRKIVSID